MAKNRKVLLTIGIPASGKSTWTQDFISKNPEWVKVSRDDVRFMLKNSPQLDFKGESLVTELQILLVRKSLLKGYNVVIDNTHCKQQYINDAIEAYSDLADIDYRYFDIKVATAIERDSKRDKKVGESIIKKMHKNLTTMLDSFDFQPVKQRNRIHKDYSKDFKKNLPYAVISDIDGTVAAMNSKRGPFEWHKVGVDDPDYPVIETLKAWKNYKLEEKHEVEIIMVSGRDESCRKETEDWLNAAGIPFSKLYMRPKDDYRKDSLIKEEIYNNHIKDKYNIVLVLDDRQQVVDTWRTLGLKVFQVEPGEF